MTIVQVTGCLVEDGQTTTFVPDEPHAIDYAKLVAGESGDIAVEIKP